MYPIIVSPHKFGLKDDLDKVFFPLMLHSLRKFNPNTKIYVPNANSFELKIKGIEEINFKTEEILGIEEIRKNYIHLSTNHENFELACIERFFILRAMAKNLRIDKFFTVESDCLIFSDLNILHKRLELDDDVTLLTAKTCISAAFITMDFLDVFCDGILKAFKSEETIAQMKNWYQDYRSAGNNGGICDMTFCTAIDIGWFGFQKMPVKDICSPYNEDGRKYALDNFFSASYISSYKDIIMEKSIFDGYPVKKYDFDNFGVYVLSRDFGRIYLNSIHCQGFNKKLMGLLYTQYTASLEKIASL